MIKPILFNTDMVRAILDGRKTVTRRLIKPEPQRYFEVNEEPLYIYDTDFQQGRIIPPYQPGDILYVRETWVKVNSVPVQYGYRVDNNYLVPRWHPSIHMPKEAARIWLKVKDVRVERLQDITEGQVQKEGIDVCNGVYRGYSDGIEMFEELWNCTIKKSDLDRYGWGANPWVWVIEFERREKPED